jgi:glycosyltransferase involved in cell wall biosynthesis
MAPLCRSGGILLDIIGDGPLLPALRDFVRTERLEESVTLHGWIAHADLQNLMCRSQLLIFPSIREFGGGVVLEAMALGIVPVVVDYAGPGELVTATTGFKVPMAPRAEIVNRLRAVVAAISAQPRQLAPMAQAARQRVKELFTWDAKAGQILQIYDWVRGQRSDKPSFFGAHAGISRDFEM